MKLPVLKTLLQSLLFAKENFFLFSLFVLANFALMMGGSFWGGWTNPAFFAFLLLAYCLWIVFFRVCFNKKPLFEFKHLGSSLVPSARILLIILLFFIAWVVIVYILAFLGVPLDFFEQSINNSKIVDAIVAVIFIVFSPIILYRPYFAWIASVIDRNKNISFAFNQTKGNYFQMLFIFVLINGLVFVFDVLDINVWFNYFISSILFTFFNVVLAKSYEFFFKV
ncbi:MAG: hypothetical protein R3Y43_02430 [Alphaproteobacteria bacterium]